MRSPVALTLAAATLAALACCAYPAATADDGSLTFAAVGDSITAWDPPYNSDPLNSWITTAVGDDLQLGGGWALSGARLELMLASVKPTDADVLVVMAGTNDVRHTTPVEDRLARLAAVIEMIGIDEVVIAAIPPLDSDPVGARVWNDALSAYATAHGITHIDPWRTLRSLDNSWVEGASADGIHPSHSAAAAAGMAIRNELVTRFG
ncbi:SGNH/GDSL hydrolase family protein [Cryobacterium sp. BB307]|uniref:SGNH/GDSL hydrolase family protein n=1 Tax=Cryobacterium sp. BB307 TaxID=2716317 RepID=UPI0014464108|nr:SGNH/GDSL hydrolase family protein [Cryobacterium sp. BB307]